MSISFSSSEIFEMAERIERDGADFYRKASQMFDNTYIQDLLVKFSRWEKRHEETFSQMRRQLSSQEKKPDDFEPETDLSLYMETMQSLDVFKNKAKELTGNERMRDVIKKAIEKEKDSIVFYLALKAFVKTETARAKIQEIIDEEMKHIGMLTVSLKEHI